MAMIPQMNLFCWENVDATSDLDRLRFVLLALPDEELMRQLEHDRGNGRDDYPIRAVFNSIIAGIVYQHQSIASLRRELQRNGELREMCGFHPFVGGEAVPPPWVYTRFFRTLFRHSVDVENMFDKLVSSIGKVLPDFGQKLAIDSKAIPSAGKPTDKEADGRRETDADWGKKEYKGKKGDGSVWNKVISWFGFKLHLVVDAAYELPIAWKLTRASEADTTQLLPLMEKGDGKHPAILGRSEILTADRGYDSERNNREVYDLYGIKPLIGIRHDWKDGESTRPLFSDKLDCIVYDEDGQIFCVSPSMDDARKTVTMPLVFHGFEPDRMTLKYRCPAAVYGYECPEREQCGCSAYGRVVRVPLSFDRRHFVPIPRQSLTWDRLYSTRTSVERVNSRLDTSFMFEHHFIRGFKKMHLRVGLALVVMLAMALGSIKAGQHKRMRSLVLPVPLAKVA